jgi:cysteine synthase A
MPEGMSEERKRLIAALGAELILTPDSESIPGAVRKAREIVAANDKMVMLDQFSNRDNARIHYEETAHELWRQMNGDISCFIAGVGSGGTLQGVGSFLKEHNKDIKIIAVEPKDVSALLGHEPGLHQIQGIGDGFIPDILDVSMVDDVIEVTDADAIETTRALGRNFGMLVGISSGANVWGARKVAASISGNIATVLSDRAERYFSTALL